MKTQRRRLFTAPLLFIIFLCALWQSFSCYSTGAPSIFTPIIYPAGDADFTASREVRAILVDGADVWAATSGGVLYIGEKAIQKFTTRDGLPTNEIRAIRKAKNGIVAVTPRGSALFDGSRWQTITDEVKTAPIGFTSGAGWRGGVVRATINELTFDKNNKHQTLSLPASTGSHISALLARGNGEKAELWAALYGDGLWLYDGAKWSRPANSAIAQSAAARDAIALAEQNGQLLIGTRRSGLWREHNNLLSRVVDYSDTEPFDHNAQAMTVFGGALFVSTLEDGLAVRSGEKWHHLETQLSSNAPRQMVSFNKALWVRHGGGRVDKFDGSIWSKHVFPFLPRQKALAIAGDANRLYVGQWGGWSEWDGKNWTHNLNLPELQGVPPMALLPDGDTLWLGTQSKGIAEIKRSTGKVRWHDERHGLPDDWITCLLKSGKEIYAGTFVGGLAHYNGDKWQAVPTLDGENVTALESDGKGGVFIATRNGVWRRAATRKMTPLKERAPWLESEAQTLCKTDAGLWIGTRTGIFFLEMPTTPERSVS